MVNRYVRPPSHLVIPPLSSLPPSKSEVSSPLRLSFSPLRYSPLKYSSPRTLFNQTSSSAVAVTRGIPGFKTSSAFFRSLRANLHLATSVDLSLPSPSNSSTHLPISSPQIPSAPLPDHHADHLRGGALSNDPISLSSTTIIHIPATNSTKTFTNLTQPSLPFPSQPPTTPSSLLSTQHLLSSSVSETRGRIYTSIVQHPATLLLYTLLLLIIFLNRALHRGHLSALGLSDSISIAMRAIVAAWVILGGLWAIVCCCVRDNESPNLRVLDDRELGIGGGEGPGQGADGEDSLVLVSERGNGDVVGAIVIRLRKAKSTSPSSFTQGHGHPGCCRRSIRAARRRRARSASGSGSGSGSYGHFRNGSRSVSGTGGNSSASRVFITAWAVDKEYRDRGVGMALLDDAVRICRERGWGVPGWGLACLPIGEDSTTAKAGFDGDSNFRAMRWHGQLVDWIVGEGGRRARGMLRKAVERDGLEGGGCGSGNGKACKGKRGPGFS